MSQKPSTEPSAGTPPPLRLLATPADLAAVDIEAPIRGSDLADAHDMYQIYEQAFVAAKADNNEPAQAVYRLFAQLCSMGLHTSDQGNIWQPLFTLTNGTQSSIAEDYRGEQIASLAAIIPRIESAGLRARIADIAWTNNRRDGASAATAIDAYCENVNGLLDGRLKTMYGLKPNIASKTPMHRALQLARFTTKPDKRPQEVLDTFTRLYDTVRDAGDIGVFDQLAELALEFRLRAAATLAPELEACAKSVPLGTYPMAVKAAWDLAARLHQSLKDPLSRKRCLMGAVEQTLAMRTQVSGAAAEAGWVMDALQQLRHIPGQEEFALKLESDLRRLQAASLDQMGSFEFDLEIGDTPQKVARHFDCLTLSDAMRTFARIDNSRDPASLRTEALEAARSSPLMAMMPFSYVDGEGRVVKKTPGAPHQGEPDEDWFTHMIDRSESIHRQRTIAAYIEPARLVIQARFGIMPRHFAAIIGHSPFVPELQKPIMALGFTRLFQGDFMSATHLLIPQLEPCLRHLLKISGADPSKRGDDSTEQDLSLKNIFVRHRAALEKVLTPAIAWEIDRLFNTRPGPALRHEVAHGQLRA